jgi:hypothetical protein
MIRAEVKHMADLGPLPDSSAHEAVIQAHEDALAAMAEPLTAEEARALLACFGQEDCFGLAWTLLHLLETAPDPPLDAKPGADANPWLHMLWKRAH